MHAAPDTGLATGVLKYLSQYPVIILEESTDRCVHLCNKTADKKCEIENNNHLNNNKK